MMRMAELWGYRRHNTNPCKNTCPYRTKPEERFLTAEEMARLNAEGQGIWILTKCWRTVCTDAKLGRPRLHDLRHTAASQAVMGGENLPLVGRLLGTRRHRTTAGYAPVADGYLVEAAEKVGTIIAGVMGYGAGPPHGESIKH